jgi:hypothetical protein
MQKAAVNGCREVVKRQKIKEGITAFVVYSTTPQQRPKINLFFIDACLRPRLCRKFP